MKDILKPLLQELLERNERTPCSLRGGAFCLGVERDPDGEPWVQVKTDVLNIFYPSDDDPVLTLRKHISGLPRGIECPDWEPWKFATLEAPDLSADEMASFIRDLFVSFYDFAEDTPVSTEIFDMR